MRNRGIMKESREKEQEKILVTRSSMPELEEYVDEIRDIWETHWLTNMGEKHKRLQRELSFNPEIVITPQIPSHTSTRVTWGPPEGFILG